MASPEESIGDPMGSQPDTTTNVPIAPPPQPGTAIPFPIIAKADFLKLMDQFYEKSTGSVHGFRPQDLIYVESSAKSDRQRGGRPDGIYFSDNQERRDIISRFYNRTVSDMQSRRISETRFELLNSAFCWAFLQVADMEVLRNLDTTLSAPTPKVFVEIEQTFIAWSIQFRIFFAKTPNTSDTARWETILETAGETLATKNSHRARDSVNEQVRSRDGNVCIVTKSPDPDVAHIYPFSGINSVYRDTLKWATATMYGGSRANAIHHKLMERGIDGMDYIGNGVCLSPDFHRAWGLGKCLFYPHRPEPDPETGGWKMNLVFYWSKKVGTGKIEQMYTDFTSTAAEQVRKRGILGPNVRAVNIWTNAPVIDGDIITIRAGTKEKLPDYDIMMLQYDVLRMATLCGAAEPEELEDGNSDVESNDPVAAEEGKNITVDNVVQKETNEMRDES